ncbi:hypothetical protein [Aeromicrobium sp. IC_218]|uniref:hypothetical protein n=1 Tax=Aeromicrobium sp. IC_218 TaxID=2545468 RepID=UPI00103E5E8B|nr:hypothetical protein [Aeromicrobium sp. IC_218]TCI98828.1 hypothetical protein E0W78_08725 [Aeromicrobium sp. IC_218]
MTSLLWLVSLLSPQSVAPHPNFASTDRVTGPGLLALVLQQRPHEIESFLSRKETEATRDEALLLQSTRDSLSDKGFQSALENFRQLAQESADAGLGAAASLVAAVGLSERDRFDEALEMLEVARERLGNSGDDELWRAAIEQQLAMRLTEMRRDADPMLESARNLLEEFSPMRASPFPTSKGSRWDSGETVRNIQGLLLDANQDLRDRRVRFPDEHQITQWIRRTESPLTISLRREAGRSGAAFIDERFKKQTLSREVTFRADDPVDTPIWRSLTAFELAGHLTESQNLRRRLGELRLMRSGASEISDALRLIRQSGDMKTVRLALNHLRSAGPIAMIRSELEGIIERRNKPELLRDVDLAVISAGAQTLDEAEAKRTLKTLISALTATPPQNTRVTQAPFVRIEQVLAAVAAVAPLANSDDWLAGSLLDVVEAAGTAPDELVARAFARCVNALEWRRLDESVTQRWASWVADAQGRQSTSWSPLLESLDFLLVPPSEKNEPAPNTLSLESIARELNAVIDGAAPATDFVDAATEQVKQVLIRARHEALAGEFTQYATDPADLAAGLCVYLGADLWTHLVELIALPIPRRFKSNAIDRLAANYKTVPDDVRAYIESHRKQIRTSISDPFEGEEVQPFPGPVRLFGMLRISSTSEEVSAVAEMLGGNEVARTEAAKTVASFCRRGPAADWLAFAAIQLSRDTNANVRAHAGRALAELVTKTQFAQPLVKEQLIALVSEEGMLVPLLILQSLAMSEHAQSLPSSLRDAISHAAQNHVAHGVRSQARRVLSMMD